MAHHRFSSPKASSPSTNDDPTLAPHLELIDQADTAVIASKVFNRLQGDRVVSVDPKDAIAVSKARAATVDRYTAWAERGYGIRSPRAINRMAAQRIKELERYLEHRYGESVPEDDAGRGDLVILANHIAQNPSEPREKILSAFGKWAPWMVPAEAEMIADKVLEKPRKYKAATLGGLLRLTEAERLVLGIKTIRPFDKSDSDMKEDRKRKDREAKSALRAANRSGRQRGRPRSVGAKLWETLGLTKSTYYRRKNKEEAGDKRSETKNRSALLEVHSYIADRF